MTEREAAQKGYKPFKVTGQRAHQRPKKNVDQSRIIWARDILHAMDVYSRQLRGVKKKKYLSVVPA